MFDFLFLIPHDNHGIAFPTVWGGSELECLEKSPMATRGAELLYGGRGCPSYLTTTASGGRE